VGEAAASVSNIGADYLTLHISSGEEALSEAVDKKSKDLNLLGVSSALTSKSVDSNTSKIVKDEFQIAKDSNLEGVICPASEIANTTNLFDLIVTPGIRLENDLHGDQKNITTPKKAIELGAKYIVMGRSIKNNPSMVINELEV
jgi:orotidine-5'-phosphate decarboxylase